MLFKCVYGNTEIKWIKRTSHLEDSNGKVLFHMDDVEVPEGWSQTATDILAQKYLRKAGVPNLVKKIQEFDGPEWLQRSEPVYGQAVFGGETSARQVFHRLAGAWTYWGYIHGYFDSSVDPLVFYREVFNMLALQIAAPASPQWFNTGLYWAYGIKGSINNHWAQVNGQIVELNEAYEHPQVHACFIQSIDDNLVEQGGIFDLLRREAQVFKYGSGTGSNFSNIRPKGSRLQGGGTSSGLMSFLKIFDSAAGAIKSGGTTRRAAKMVIVDAQHPEARDFVIWKSTEEAKARLLAREGLDPDEALSTVSGQNSNNSLRINGEEFFKDLDAQDPRTVELWNSACEAAWFCGDPGLHFSDTVNLWHTCKANGAIRASNPCSEYLFLDDTACNLASINLVTAEPHFDHVVQYWTTVLDITNSMAGYPSQTVAEKSLNYRTIGLGYANLGAYLMRKALAYDSPQGRTAAARITAQMQIEAIRTSQALAAKLGAFPLWAANREHVAAVIQQHIEAYNLQSPSKPTDLDPTAPVRNAQFTVLAPTGTIALLMDCDTTGVEPDFALVKTKRLAGGGEFKLVNQSIGPALKALQYTDSQVRAVEEHLRAGGTLESMPTRNGQPFILPRHRPIFACAHEISPEAHVQMVSAVQPFISGGVSKTINMPPDATVEDVKKIYRLAHTLGLKSISIYRDGCKLTQPLTSAVTTPTPTPTPASHFGTRSMLPARRRGYTNKYHVNGQTLYLRTGEYDDGSLGEIFIDLNKAGSTNRSLMQSFAIAISIGLQYGVPLSEFVEAFTHTQFEPRGLVQGHDKIRICSSILDLVFRDLSLSYSDDSTEPPPPIPESPPIGTPSGEPCPRCGQQLFRSGTCLYCSCGEQVGGCG